MKIKSRKKTVKMGLEGMMTTIEKIETAQRKIDGIISGMDSGYNVKRLKSLCNIVIFLLGEIKDDLTAERFFQDEKEIDNG